MPLPPLPPDELLIELERLLQLERAEEEKRDRERREGRTAAEREAAGDLIRHLHVRAEDMGTGGLWRLTLARADGRPLAASRIQPGDPVSVRAGTEDEARGVLAAKSLNSLDIVLAAGDVPEWDSDALSVEVLPQSVTFERARSALDAARRVPPGRARRLRDVLLGACEPAVAELDDVDLPTHLHDSQRMAVQLALGSPDVALIHGPPGTGKTTTAAALVASCVARGDRVLVCAASNTGADELARAVHALGRDVVRVGHPARVDAALHPLLLDERVRRHERFRLAHDLVRKAENLRNRSGQSRKDPVRARQEREERRREWRAMLADARLWMAQAEEETLRRTRVVASTLAVAGSPLLQRERFDTLVLDEASQATIPLSMIALGMAERWVMVGDHRQLPPTVLSAEAQRGGLDETLFDRLMRDPAVPSSMLTMQHRMHMDIMAFPSQRQYGGRLRAHPTVSTRALPEHVAVDRTPWMWVDTAGTGFSEEQRPGDPSWSNPGEAQLCALMVRQLVAGGLSPQSIGLITPYRAQVEALMEILAPECQQGLEIDSVDAFQGREKEAIILSLVRSNEAGTVGFVADARRMNVALTRARSWLRVVADGSTVGLGGEGEALLEHAQQRGAYMSAYAWPGFDGLKI